MPAKQVLKIEIGDRSYAGEKPGWIRANMARFRYGASMMSCRMEWYISLIAFLADLAVNCKAGVKAIGDRSIDMLAKSLRPNMAKVQIQSTGQPEGATTCSNNSIMTAVRTKEQAVVLSMNDRKNKSTVLIKTE